MGGIIAYELAHKLLATRNPLPEHLFLSGVKPPRLKRKHLHVDFLNDQELLEEIIHLGGDAKRTIERGGITRINLLSLNTMRGIISI